MGRNIGAVIWLPSFFCHHLSASVRRWAVNGMERRLTILSLLDVTIVTRRREIRMRNKLPNQALQWTAGERVGSKRTLLARRH
jgi:hypothetical protein